MGKKLDLSKPVFELVQEYPELTDILKDLGFTEITKTAMLHSVGRITTIPKGAKMRGISMMKVVMTLMRHGFELTGKMPDLSVMGNAADDAEAAVKNDAAENSTELLKSYLKRLGAGEDLESVRKDFVEHFSEVEASEIMKAEQELMKEGTPITEVQKLCDVHSALFHGATKEEKIANAERAVEASLKKEAANQNAAAQAAAGKANAVHAGAAGTMSAADQKALEAARRQLAAAGSAPNPYQQKQEAAKRLRETAGHPLERMTRENERISAYIKEMQDDMEAGREVGEKLSVLRQLAIHYAEKGDLLYPVLKVRYEITGPSDIMWTVDDEIRDELSALDKNQNHDEEWTERVRQVLKRAEEMIYKEGNILFPICAVNFSEEEWYGIYEDAKDYAPVFEVESIWPEAEAYIAEKKKHTEAALGDGEVVMGGGHMTVAQLEAMLNTLPIEITFVDADNINRFFNEGPKVFKRPQMAIDREVFSCHPPKIEPMVRAIFDDFRNHRRDSVPV
ncbi:MAG: DUF438 domain-containing protein, partial [Lachnospiraceae bacterium]|nr:DUF438 domain-containing protein [Lachnospiraceae bacterium]